jgi:hypothetical protein
MSKHQTHLAPVKFRSRPGEGAILEVGRKMVPHPDGTAGFQISLDLLNAPVPERRYVADGVNLTHSNGFVHLVFWQKKITGNEARSMVVLSLTSFAVLQYLQNAEAQIDQLEKTTGKLKIEGSLEKLPEEPAQTVCLAANIIATGWSGREACMDFYHASPFVFGMLANNGKFAAEPIVRVSLSTGVLLALFRQLELLKPSFPQDELEAIKTNSSQSGGSADA